MKASLILIVSNKGEGRGVNLIETLSENMQMRSLINSVQMEAGRFLSPVLLGRLIYQVQSPK